MTERTRQGEVKAMPFYALDTTKSILANLAARVLEDLPDQIEISLPPAKFGADLTISVFKYTKLLNRKVPEIAEDVAREVRTSGLATNVTVAGGFVNIQLDRPRLVEMILENFDPNWPYGTQDMMAGRRVVIDYSSPNVAKEMHIGHIRSTVIGDSLVRILGFLAAEVIRQNHLGDWGTQFGKLIEHLIESKQAVPNDIHALTQLYKEAEQRYRNEPDFAGRARHRVVLLQSHDPKSYQIWEDLYRVSKGHFSAIYALLDVKLEEDDIRGESFYQDQLQDVVDELQAKGVVRESEGAIVVFAQDIKGRPINVDKDTGKPVPLIIKKTNGGFGYGATDLAGVRFRIKELGADIVLYVVDVRQADHFRQVLWAAREAGWLDEQHVAKHLEFGTILGEDRRPYKTRSGDVVPLGSVLTEAIERAAKIIEAKNPDLPADERARVAKIVGIGALKYFDLARDRGKDYVFDWDAMLAMEGNTGPYLQYTFARIRSMLREAEELKIDYLAAAADQFTSDEVFELLMKVAFFPETIRLAAVQFYPHLLATYLFELAQAYNSYYVQYPILKEKDAVVRDGRLRLSGMVAEVLQHGLYLLGIEAPERM